MPINYIPSGVRRNDLYSAIGSTADLCDAINTTLTAAGWNSTPIKGHNHIQFAAQPANGNTITIGAHGAYTFVTVIAGANTVLIDTTVAGTAENLMNAINLGPGSGTKYGAATPANTDCVASIAVATGYESFSGNVAVTITTNDSAFTASGVPLAKSGANLSYYYVNNASANSQWVGWGYKLRTPVTPQGLWGQIYVYSVHTANEGDANHIVRVITSSPDLYDNAQHADGFVTHNDTTGFTASVGHILQSSASVAWRIIANPYQLFVMVDGVSGTNCQYKWYCMGVPYIPTWQTPISITGATNATPIVLTTAVPHLRTTGDVVCCRQVSGNTAPNLAATWVVTVLTATTLSLDTSVGNGAYAGGGILGGVNSQVAECFWTQSPTGGPATGLFRYNSTADGIDAGYLINGSLSAGVQSGTGVLGLLPVCRGNTAYSNTAVPFYNGYFAVTTPWIGGGTSAASTFKVAGTPWDMGLWQKIFTLDQTGTFDGHTFFNLTDSQAGISNSIIQCSALVAIT